jgi:hypothetical protein
LNGFPSVGANSVSLPAIQTHLDWRSGKDADVPETQDYSSVAALIWKHLSEKTTMLSVVVQQFGKIEILPGSCDS